MHSIFATKEQSENHINIVSRVTEKINNMENNSNSLPTEQVGGNNFILEIGELLKDSDDEEYNKILKRFIDEKLSRLNVNVKDFSELSQNDLIDLNKNISESMDDFLKNFETKESMRKSSEEIDHILMTLEEKLNNITYTPQTVERKEYLEYSEYSEYPSILKNIKIQSTDKEIKDNDKESVCILL